MIEPFSKQKLYNSTVSKVKDINNIKIDLNKPHENQIKILKSKARYRVVACGRRFGKSEAAKISATLRLFKGECVWFCSPTNQNSKRMFRQFEKLFKSFPENLVNINKTDMRIDLLWNDAFIEFKSLAEPDNLRGEGLNFIVVDEAAFVANHVWDEILAPMLLSTRGDALFISSTNGRNWFWKMYQRGLDENETDYESFHFTSYDNPLIKKEDIDALRKTTPSHVFEREYMAIFEESGGQVFKQIDRVLREEENELEYVVEALRKAQNDEIVVVFGIDWAKKEDYTVITVFDLTNSSLIEYHRINQMLWEDILDEIKFQYKKWQPTYILAEENNSLAQIEQLQKDGLPIEGIWTGSKSKPLLINKLVLAIEQQEISLPNDKLLIGELSAFEMTQTAIGNIKYAAASGMHDDIIMSLCFANYCRENVYTPQELQVISI